MFPSGGYFRSANCPFFTHGLCHRPYCHFRHAKPEYKPTPILPSNSAIGHSKQENNESVNVAAKDNVKIKSSTEKQKRKPRTDSNGDVQDKKEVLSSASPLFKRTALEEKLIANSGDIGDISSDSDDNGSEIIQDSMESDTKLKTDSDVIKADVELKTSAVDKVVSLDRELKTISGSSSGIIRKDIEPNDSLNNIEHTESMDVISVDNRKLSSKQVVNVSEDVLATNKTKTSTIVNDNLGVLIQDLQEFGKGVDVDIKAKKETSKTEEKDSQINDASKTEPPQLSDVPFFSSLVVKRDSSKKKRKGRKLDQVKDNTSEQKNEITNKNKKRMNDLGPKKASITKEKSKIQRYKELKKLVKNSDKILTDLGESLKKSKTLVKDCENVLIDVGASHKKSKSHLKDSPKVCTNSGKSPKKTHVKDSKKESSSASESPKKSKTRVKESDKVTRVKESDKVPPVVEKDKKTKNNIMDPEKASASVSESSKKSKKLVKDCVDNLTSVGKSVKKNKIAKEFNIYKETIESDGVNIEDDSEEQELLRIFNEYNPCDEQDVIDDDCVTALNMLEDNKMYNFSDQSSCIKRPSSDEGVVVFKKQRVAHQPSHLIQRQAAPMRSSSTFRRLPRPLQGTLLPSVQVTHKPTERPREKDLVTSTHVKQRVTHFAKSSGTLTSRPRIRLEYGAKVPQTVRQKYLDKLIDEYLLSYEDQQEAFDRAEKEEKSIYLKSPRRQMYTNLCVNLIKKLRDDEVGPKDNEELHVGKRNPLVEKSTLPTSPPKRLKIEKSAALQFSENLVNIKLEKMKKNDNSANLTEEVFYTHLETYLLSEEQMTSNGFPRPSNVAGHAEITDMYSKIKISSSDPTRHICCRCGKPFVILESGDYREKEECVYHHGRLLRRRTAGELITSYTCCQGESGCIGCSVAKAHVKAIDWAKESDFMTTIDNPCGPTHAIFALDCEMCYTTKGLELTRVTVVDYKMNKVYDTLVKPDHTILDYNTRFSGITEESMIGVKTTLRDVQAVLLTMVHKDTILLGHSLESDLKSLKIIHSTIVDTSVVFPHRLGPPYKRALRNLMGEYVRKIIQNNEEGHDSLEDAVSCVELMLWKVKEDIKMEERNKKH